MQIWPDASIDLRQLRKPTFGLRLNTKTYLEILRNDSEFLRIPTNSYTISRKLRILMNYFDLLGMTGTS